MFSGFPGQAASPSGRPSSRAGHCVERGPLARPTQTGFRSFLDPAKYGLRLQEQETDSWHTDDPAATEAQAALSMEAWRQRPWAA
ncbi:MAG: hypothetical protein Kow0026_25510 [Oricola sp.]